MNKLTILSGGQTSVDRSSLDWATKHGFPHREYCPKGHLAEDGVIPKKYKLMEAKSSNYQVRTRLNVIDSDATLILSTKPLTGGTDLTARYGQEERKTIFLITPNVE